MAGDRGSSRFSSDVGAPSFITPQYIAILAEGPPSPQRPPPSSRRGRRERARSVANLVSGTEPYNLVRETGGDQEHVGPAVGRRRAETDSVLQAAGNDSTDRSFSYASDEADAEASDANSNSAQELVIDERHALYWRHRCGELIGLEGIRMDLVDGDVEDDPLQTEERAIDWHSLYRDYAVTK